MLRSEQMKRLKEEPWEEGFAQWYEEKGVKIRIFTQLSWDVLELRMRDYYTERAEEYFRIRHHTDLNNLRPTD
jgi:hypothetical protein